MGNVNESAAKFRFDESR